MERVGRHRRVTDDGGRLPEGEPLFAVYLLAWPRDRVPFELAGGHSIDDTEPKYGLAVTGSRTRRTCFATTPPEAVATMTTLNRDASRSAVQSGATCATDVTGFGLLGHLHKLCRASSVSAVLDSAVVPYLDGARTSYAAGVVPGGSRRNLEWVRPHLSSSVSDDELLLLADAQTSGGLLVAGELPGHPVVGELVPRQDASIVVR